MSEGGRRFYLQKRLGAGAFGEVYLAEQDSGAGFRRRVAIKLLNPEVAGIAEVGRRMRDEARILGRLSHRNIVTVFDLAKLSGQWAVVMDYVRGVDLDRLLEAMERDDEYFPVPAALEVGAAVCEALHAAFHTDDGRGGTLGVVHRDIKPSNVLLTADGDVKVLDFGVARVNLDTRESKTGIQVGTVRYMSPTRLCGDEEGPPGDIYAVGASIAELLLRRPIGRSPIEDNRHAEFVDAALAEVGDLVEAPDDVKQELIELLRRTLHVEPEQRPSARQLANAFTELSRRLPGTSLKLFAQQIVPRVEASVGAEHETVDRVLSESSSDGLSGQTGPTLGPKTTGGDENATMADFGPPPPNRTLPLVVIAVGGLVGVAAIAVLAVVAAVALGIGRSATDVEASVTSADPPPGVAEQAPPAEPAEPVAVEPPVEAATATVPDAPVVDAEGTADATPEAPSEPPPKAAPPKRSTAKSPPPPAEPPPPAPDAPKVSRAMVVMQDASSIEVTCGGVVARGTASARITDFPAGTCRVRATYLGRELSADVTVDRPREITCTASDSLACQ